METTDAPDRLLIQFSDGRFAFCPVSGGKIGTLASCPLPHGEEQADALRSLLRQKALQCPEGGATVLYDTDRVCLIPAEYYREEDAERYHDPVRHSRRSGTPHGRHRAARRKDRADKHRTHSIRLPAFGLRRSARLYASAARKRCPARPETAACGGADPQLRSPVGLRRGLLFAETLPRHSDADLLYYLGA